MDRVVLITGSTRGIGFSTAAEFVRHGDVVVIQCRHEKHVATAVRGLALFNKKPIVLGLVGDVRKPADVNELVEKCLQRFGRLDILVNNAGVGVYKPILASTDQDWDRIVDTNLKGTFLCTRRALSVMTKQRQGIVINVASGLGVEGMAGFSIYCASKFGVVGITKAVADELGESEVKIYAVLPGAVDTTLLSGTGLDVPPSERLKPDYVGRRIFETAEGKEPSGSLIEVYS